MGEWSEWMNLKKSKDMVDLNMAGVYEIGTSEVKKLPRFFGFDKGEEGRIILLIGMSKSLKDRLNQFWNAVNGKGNHSEGEIFFWFSLHKVFKIDKLDFRFKRTQNEEEAKLEEGRLLDDYEERYGELPPLNRARGKYPDFIIYLEVRGTGNIEIKRGKGINELENVFSLRDVNTVKDKKFVLWTRVWEDNQRVKVEDYYIFGSNNFSEIAEKLNLSQEKIDEINRKIKWLEERPKQIKKYLGLTNE